MLWKVNDSRGGNLASVATSRAFSFLKWCFIPIVMTSRAGRREDGFGVGETEREPLVVGDGCAPEYVRTMTGWE